MARVSYKSRKLSSDERTLFSMCSDEDLAKQIWGVYEKTTGDHPSFVVRSRMKHAIFASIAIRLGMEKEDAKDDFKVDNRLIMLANKKLGEL